MSGVTSLQFSVHFLRAGPRRATRVSAARGVGCGHGLGARGARQSPPEMPAALDSSFRFSHAASSFRSACGGRDAA